MTNAPFKIFVCILILGSFLVESSLFVNGPDALKKSFESTKGFKGLEYVVASSKYGYTKSNFKGTLVAPDPIDGCKIISSDKITENYNPVVIVREGECSFLQKARNAEIANAKMLILVLNQSNLDDYREFLKNFEYTSNIETLIIMKEDGDRLLKALEDKEELKISGSPTISYTTEREHHANYVPQSDVVEVDYWFATSDIDEGSYVVLEYLMNFKYDFGSKLKVKPHFVLWESDYAKYKGYDSNHPRCLSNGRYCDPEPDNIANLQGKESVLETLRQICLGDVLPEGRDNYKWWNYVLKFGNQCIVSDVDDKNTNACRDRILKELELDRYTTKVNECMAESFEASAGTRDMSQISSDNLKLKREFDVQKANFVSHYPLISANRAKYTGSIYNVYGVKDHICSAFSPDKMPAVCSSEITGNTEPSGSSFWVSFWTLLMCAIIMVVLIYCMRRTVKRQVMSNMHHEISTIVSQYKKIGDSNDDNA